MRRIPAIISIDVEPDGLQSSSTTGYDATVALVERLRPRLAAATGRSPSFGWFFRMDPQIAGLFGRADHLATGFGDRAGRLLAAGDHVGLHTHPVRWEAERRTWIHDLGEAWVRKSLRTSFAAFEGCFGAPCERHRVGAGLFDQTTFDALDELGVKVDTALEPVRSWAFDATDVPSSIDSSPIVGRFADCLGAPRRAYRPAPGDFMRPTRRGHGLAIVPMTTTRRREDVPEWRVVARTVKWRSKPRLRMAYFEDVSDPTAFWDLANRELRLMRRPYLNIAIRTDPLESPRFQKGGAALETLADHPLARRMEVVDPLEALPGLLGEPVAPPLLVSTPIASPSLTTSLFVRR